MKKQRNAYELRISNMYHEKSKFHTWKIRKMYIVALIWRKSDGGEVTTELFPPLEDAKKL